MDIHADNEFDKAELKNFYNPSCFTFVDEMITLVLLRDLCGQSKNDSGQHVAQ